MSACISDRKEWLLTLSLVLCDSSFTKRFSRIRIKSGLTFKEFLFNEKQFYKIFKKALKDGTFKILSAKKVTLANKSKREIFKFDVFENFIFRHVSRLLSCKLEKHISPRVFGRPTKGVNQALNDLRNFLRQEAKEQVWIIRRDLKDFGMSIPHALLLEKLASFKILKEQELKLFKELIDFEYLDQEAQVLRNLKGSPTGTQLQQLVNNFYLNDLDRQMESASAYYIRYGDDILVVADCESRMTELKLQLDTEIRKIGLTVNSKKSTEILLSSLTSNSVRFSYLGRELTRNGNILLSKDLFKKVKKDIDFQLKKTNFFFSKESEECRIKILCQTCRELLSARHFNSAEVSTHHLVKLECKNSLRKFDQWLALKVLQIGLSKGFKQSNLRFYSQTDLRKMGLPNLLRWRL